MRLRLSFVSYKCLNATSGNNVGRASRTACLLAPRRTTGIVSSGYLVAQRSDLFDPDLDHIAGFEELAARRADPGRRSREDEVAGMERHPARQLRDLLGQVEDHVLAVGVLFEDVVDPQLEPQILGIADVARRHDPGPERA